MNAHITVSATEANRSFSKLLREVARGKRVEITSHGRAVATLAPVEDEAARKVRQLAALKVLKKRWATQDFKVVGPWSREELYERDR